jgi:hypothetical protein
MSYVRLKCQSCCLVQSVDQTVLTHHRSIGQTKTCVGCGGLLQEDKVSNRDNRRRSKKQENRVARREGARRQPGSGAISGLEGDVRLVGQYRGECKFTRAASYSLKLSDLKKLELQAASSELPVFDIEFQSESPPKRYVIMPEWAYETLMSESGRRND